MKKRKINFQLEKSIIAKRTINYNNIDILFNIKGKNEVMFVNDSKESTHEALTSLEEIGINHIKFIPYYPEKSGIIKKYKIAVTPGEVDKVPPFVEKIYDIGSRLIEMETLILILNKLGLFSLNSNKISNNFLNKIVKLNETIIESELFGYEKGAFTGANPKGKKGFFELAKGGTIFLDEIGDISLKIQSRLLRVLEEKEIVRLGGEKIIPIDIRIIGATNKDIYQMCKENKFRKDLYYRLRSGYLRIPPLRERKEDIETIIEDFLIKNSHEDYKISKDAMDFLKNYTWEGNVRELINTISYAILLSDSKTITIDALMENDFLKNKIKCEKKERIFNRDKIKIEIINIIKESALNGLSIGRTKIYENLNKTYNISEYKVRKLIDELKKEGKIKQGKKSQGLKYIN